MGFRYRGACEGGANPPSELDHALAMIGSAHWIENFGNSAPLEIGDKAPRSSGSFGALGPVPAAEVERLLWDSKGPFAAVIRVM